MSYFDNDFFEFASSPLSPGINSASNELRVEFADLVSPTITVTRRSLGAGGVSWDTKEFLFEPSEPSPHSHAGAERTAQRSPELTYWTMPLASDDEDALLDGGASILPPPPPRQSRTRAQRGPSSLSPSDLYGLTSPTSFVPYLIDLGSPQVSTHRSPQASDAGGETWDGTADDEAPWDVYMTQLGASRNASPLAVAVVQPTAAFSAGGCGVTEEDEDEDQEADGESAYFADIMPLLVECGEAMQRQQDRQRGGTSTSSSLTTRTAANSSRNGRVMSGFLSPNVTPSHIAPLPSQRVDFPALQSPSSPAQVSAGRHTLAKHFSYHLLALSSDDDESDAARQAATEAAEDRWLAGFEGGAFYYDAVEAESPPLPASSSSDADGDVTPRSLPLWTVPSISPPDMETHASERPAVRRPSRNGGRLPITARRAVQMTALEDEPESDLLKSDATRNATPESPKRHIRSSRRGRKAETVSRRTNGVEDEDTTRATSAPLRTVLVTLHDAAPSSAVVGQSAFTSRAHYTKHDLLECEEMADAAECVVSGKSAASIILHGQSGAQLLTSDGHVSTAPRGILAEMSTFFSLFFEALGRHTVQTETDTFCAQASVVLLKQDMYCDLLQPAGIDGFRTLLVAGTPLLGPRVGGAALHTLTSCAGTMELLQQSMSSLIRDDLVSGAVLVSVYVKQTAVPRDRRSKSKRRHPVGSEDVLLSSYSALISTPHAFHDMAITGLYPITSGLIWRCFRGAVLPSFVASLYEMTHEEAKLTTELAVLLTSQVRPSPPRPGSVPQLLASIHRQAKVFHTMLSTARAESDTARRAWTQACERVKTAREMRTTARERRKLVSPTRNEKSEMARLYTAYQKRHRRWLRLDFLLRSLAGIAADCEATMQSSADSLPPIYLVTTHYLRQPSHNRSGSGDGHGGGSAWRFVSSSIADPTATHGVVRFASNQPLYVSDSDDDDEYVPANTPVGKDKRMYPFSFRQPRGGQPRSFGEPDLPPLMSSLSVNLFSGGYGCATMLGIHPLFNPSSQYLRRLFGLPKQLRPTRSPTVPCPLLELPATPLIRSVIVLDERDEVTAVADMGMDEEDVVLEKCVEKLDDHLVQAGVSVATRTFQCDEVCSRTSSPGISDTTTSTVLSEALQSFLDGYNAYVYYAVLSEPSTVDRCTRLRQTPLWRMLRDMAATLVEVESASPRRRGNAPASASRRLSLSSSTARGGFSLFLSACHVVSADMVSDLMAPLASARHTQKQSPPPQPPQHPFCAAWTPAGPVVQGCQYVPVPSVDAFETALASVSDRLESTCRHGAHTHIRLSFLLQLHGGSHSSATEPVLSSLTVWLTSSPILFASLGMQTAVPLSHKINLLRPHYCKHVVYVTDVCAKASRPDAVVTALFRQAELCRTMAVPLFPCQWRLRVYLQYLTDRQAAFRAVAAKLQQAEGVCKKDGGQRNPAATDTDTVLPQPPRRQAGSSYTESEAVVVGQTTTARDVLDACGVLERMRGAVVRALNSSASGQGSAGLPPSTPLAASFSEPCVSGILALTSDGSELYDIAMPHVGDPTTAAVPPAPPRSSGSQSPTAHTPTPEPVSDGGGPLDSASQSRSARAIMVTPQLPSSRRTAGSASHSLCSSDSTVLSRHPAQLFLPTPVATGAGFLRTERRQSAENTDHRKPPLPLPLPDATTRGLRPITNASPKRSSASGTAMFDSSAHIPRHRRPTISKESSSRHRGAVPRRGSSSSSTCTPYLSTTRGDSGSLTGYNKSAPQTSPSPVPQSATAPHAPSLPASTRQRVPKPPPPALKLTDSMPVLPNTHIVTDSHALSSNCIL